MAELSSVTWDIQPDKAFEYALEHYSDAVVFLINATIRDMHDEIVQWMKDNARWTDETGDARASLDANTFTDGDIITTELSYGVYIRYATYLEGWNPKTNAPMLNAGQWDILSPTVDYWGPRIIERIRQKFSGGTN